MTRNFRTRSSIRSLRELDFDAHLRDPTIKQRYVTTLFDAVARRYDRFTRWFSFGMDRGWKREMVDRVMAAVPHGGTVLDLACGTGDLALAAGQRCGLAVKVIGIDAAPRMLDVAQDRCRALGVVNVRWARGDMMAIPLPRSSVDVVTVGYGFRNTPDYGRAIDEIGRVLRPEGVLLSLDFFKPTRHPWKLLFPLYLTVAGRLYGWLWHREPQAYGYIARSITAWINAGEFEHALTRRGFIVQQMSSRFGGGIAIHHAELIALAA